MLKATFLAFYFTKDCSQTCFLLIPLILQMPLINKKSIWLKWFTVHHLRPIMIHHLHHLDKSWNVRK
uniref:Ovule protein n=1 Tax=Panagrolaimus sp. ES5 TaxID=591445 RepID=A0AC34FIV4_9BILA